MIFRCSPSDPVGFFLVTGRELCAIHHPCIFCGGGRNAEHDSFEPAARTLSVEFESAVRMQGECDEQD